MNTHNRPTRGRSRFFSNTVALVVQTILATLITLAQVKILSNFLDKETFGLFASLRGFSLLVAMIAANGLPQLLVRYIPFHESHGESGRAIRLTFTCLAGSMLLLIALGTVAYGLRRWLFAFLAPGIVTNQLIVWFAITTAAVTLKQVLYGGMSGLRRMTVQVLIELLSLAAVLVWIAVACHHLTLALLFEILGTVHGISVLLGAPLYLIMLARVKGGEPRGERTTAYREYLLWAVGISFVAIAFTDADRYLLAQVLSLEILALFHIGARVARVGHRLLGVANLAFQPEMTRIFAEGRQSEISDTTRIFMKFNVAAAMVLAGGVVLFAREIIVIVASRDYLTAVPLTMILAASLPLATLTAPITSVMKALDEVRGALIVDLAWALFYVSLILVLAPRFELIGVGVANVAACLAQLVVAVRLSKLSVTPTFLASVGFKVVAAALVCWWPVYALDIVLGPSVATTAVKLLLFVAGTALYPRMLRAFAVFDSGERSKVHAILDARGLHTVGRLF